MFMLQPHQYIADTDHRGPPFVWVKKLWPFPGAWEASRHAVKPRAADGNVILNSSASLRAPYFASPMVRLFRRSIRAWL